MSEPEQLGKDDVIWDLKQLHLSSALGESILKAANHISKYPDGIECEVLRLNSTWRKGKIKAKITLEFYPEPESQNETQENESQQWQ